MPNKANDQSMTVIPRALVPSFSLLLRRLYWSDWNRDGPKIEMSNMDGTDRTVLVSDDIELPNGLSFDQHTRQLCWADAGWRFHHINTTIFSLEPDVKWLGIIRACMLQAHVRLSALTLTLGWGEGCWRDCSTPSILFHMEEIFTTQTGEGTEAQKKTTFFLLDTLGGNLCCYWIWFEQCNWKSHIHYRSKV